MNHAPSTRATTATGEVPRFDPVMPTDLPEAAPADLPEYPRVGATTGIMPVILDAADPDKFADSPNAGI
ncbi:MAG: hypothetical protein SGJ24_01945 [Chloroflexota bacterium]|nr:hypothetical protein [Chloroflexota bacterium]